MLDIQGMLSNFQTRKKNRMAVYTAVTNAYDSPPEPKYRSADTDYYIYSDNWQDDSTATWEGKKIDFVYRDPRRLAKIFKVFPHYLFPKYEYSVWIDANMEIIGPLDDLVEEYFEDNNEFIAFCKHSKRTSVREEANESIKWGNDQESVIKEQMQKYFADGFPDLNRLIAGGFIIRKHNDSRCQNLMDAWWDEIDSFSSRDQLSFNYTSWKNGLSYIAMDLNQHNNRYFNIHPHPKLKVYDEDGKVALNRKVAKAKFKHFITSSRAYCTYKRLLSSLGLQKS